MDFEELVLAVHERESRERAQLFFEDRVEHGTYAENGVFYQHVLQKLDFSRVGFDQVRVVDPELHAFASKLNNFKVDDVPQLFEGK